MQAAERLDQRRQHLAQLAGGDGHVGIEAVVVLARVGGIDTGAELFGDFRPLSDSTLAANGFAALAAL